MQCQRKDVLLPRAEIVIPVHSEDRPVWRAAESVLADPRFGVLVVAHGVRPRHLRLPDSHRLRIVEVGDHVGYPGYAFNKGFDATNAEWVGILGSDDWYAPGAVTAMLDHATQDACDGVVAPLRMEGADRNTGLPKTWRRRGLQGRRDHLFWRTSPLGLYRRQLMLQDDFRFSEDVRAGVDQINSVLLWTSGAKFSYYPHDPPYVVGDGAPTRVSKVGSLLSEHADIWMQTWLDERVLSLPLADRRLLANRLLTVHVFSVLRSRPEGFSWSLEDRRWIADLMALMEASAPGFVERLTLSKKRAYREAAQGRLSEAGRVLREASYVENRLPSSPTALLDRDFWLNRKPSDWLSAARTWVAR